MAQDNNINPVSFFTDSRSSRLSELNNKAEANTRNNSESHSNFDKSLSSALNPKKPAKALPFAAAKSEKQKPNALREDRIFAHSEERPITLSKQDADSPVEGNETSDRTYGVPSTSSGDSDRRLQNEANHGSGVEARLKVAQAKLEKGEAGKENLDDKQGVMKASYEGSTVSYPVKRIASESIDEATEESLKEKGLWEVPTVFAAEPTSKTLSMAEVVEKSPRDSKVPVQKPIAQFMASLENELGVSHDRLVSAFQNLPPGTLQKSPAGTMTEVIKGLNLTGEDESKATELYSKMLQQMEMLDQPKVMSQQIPLIGLNDQFGEESAPGLEKPRNASQMKDSLSKYGAKSSPALQKFAEKNSSVDEMVKPQTKLEGFLGKNSGTEKESSLAGENDFQEAGAFRVQSGGEKNFRNEAPDSVVKLDGVSANAGLTSQVLAGKQEMPKGYEAASFATSGAKGQAKDVKEMKLGSLKPSQPNLSGMGGKVDNFTGGELKNPTGISAGSSLEGALKTSGEETKHEAIQSIVKNAQLLASKGGGEMHMILKPEHLGEIHMRVVMNGQKMDVQMTTEKSEVKKLIEQSIHELKHSLASHDLNMEKLNVTLNNKNAQNDFQQGQKDFAQAREFSQSFHQQNQARRELAELDIPGGSGLRGNLSSRAEAASRLMASQVGSRGPGRLNVVA